MCPSVLCVLRAWGTQCTDIGHGAQRMCTDFLGPWAALACVLTRCVPRILPCVRTGRVVRRASHACAASPVLRGAVLSDDRTESRGVLVAQDTRGR